MCDRNSNGQYPSCISALLDGPGAEDHGFCEPCSMEIRRHWKEMNLQVGELTKQRDDAKTAEGIIQKWYDEVCEDLKESNRLVDSLQKTAKGYRRMLWVLARNHDGLSLRIDNADLIKIPDGAELLVWEEKLFDATMLKAICSPINQPDLATPLKREVIGQMDADWTTCGPCGTPHHRRLMCPKCFGQSK